MSEGAGAVGVFEKVIWVLGGIVMVVALGAALLLKPSPIVLCELELIKVTEERFNRVTIEMYGAVPRGETADTLRRKAKAASSPKAVSRALAHLYQRTIAPFTRSGQIRLHPYVLPDRRLVEKYSTWQDLLQEARRHRGHLVVDRSGVIIGFQFEYIPPDSPLRNFGLKEGDIVTSVCGEPISDDVVSQMRDLFSRYRDSNFLFIEFTRVENGRQQRHAITCQFGQR